MEKKVLVSSDAAVEISAAVVFFKPGGRALPSPRSSRRTVADYHAADAIDDFIVLTDWLEGRGLVRRKRLLLQQELGKRRTGVQECRYLDRPATCAPWPRRVNAKKPCHSVDPGQCCALQAGSCLSRCDKLWTSSRPSLKMMDPSPCKSPFKSYSSMSTIPI